MVHRDCFKILGTWGARFESPAQLAVRTKSLLSALAHLNSVFDTWYQADYGIENGVHVDDDLDAIAKRIGHKNKDDPDPPKAGHFSALSTRLDLDADRWRLELRAGGSGWQYVDLSSSYANARRDSGIGFDVARGAIRCIRNSFAADWCAALDLGLRDDDDRDRRIRWRRDIPLPLAWMIELSPPLAVDIVPPTGAIHERLPDGSLFIAATREIFSADDPAHVAAARAIFGVVEPLNFVPVLPAR